MRAQRNDGLLEGHGESVLAYFMTEPTASDKYLHRIAPEVFSDPTHGTIFGAIHDLHDQREKINLVTVSNRLAEKRQLKECGGKARIAEIATSTTSKEIAESAIDCILGDWRERQVAQIGKQLTAGEITPAEGKAQLESLSNHAGNKPKQISIRSPGQILKMPRNTQPPYLGDNVFAEGRSLLISGIGGIGKSRLVRQQLVAFNTGRPWCGIETHAKGRRCLLLQTQDNTARLQADLESLKRWVGKDWKLVEENFRIHTLETDDDLLLNLSDPENARCIEAKIREENPAIIAFDPLNEFGIGNLSLDVDMGLTCRELGRIARAGDPNRSLITLHHALTGREGARKAFGMERTGFSRNSKVLHTWARAAINVVPANDDNNDTLLLFCAKNNDGKEFPPVAGKPLALHGVS